MKLKILLLGFVAMFVSAQMPAKNTDMHCAQFAAEVAAEWRGQIPFFRLRNASKEDMRVVAVAFCRANSDETLAQLHRGFWGQYK
jgi:hypothetical protein